jgi:hypothetical protein
LWSLRLEIAGGKAQIEKIRFVGEFPLTGDIPLLQQINGDYPSEEAFNLACVANKIGQLELACVANRFGHTQFRRLKLPQNLNKIHVGITTLFRA